MSRINKVFLLLFLVFLTHYADSQSFQLIHKGKSRQSSLYDICKVSDNEYWIGGKAGTLLIMDSIGNRTEIKMTETTGHILRILSNEDYVFLSTSEGFIYRYDRANQTFSLYDLFSKRNLCIYDMIMMKGNTLLIAGGAKKIASGHPAYPRGFIYLLDINNDPVMKTVWSNPNAFVFTLARHQNEIVASAFQIPAFRSALIYSSDEGLSWQKRSSVKGMISAFASVGDELYYSGSPNIHYYKNGMYGSVTNPDFRVESKGSGCFHNIITDDDRLYLSNYKGGIESLNLYDKSIEKLYLRNSNPLYRMIEMQKNKICIVGHGYTIYFMNTVKESIKDMSESEKKAY